MPTPTITPTKALTKKNHARLNNLPNLEALICFLHAVARSPIKSTWLQAIRAGNYDSWPGLTHAAALKYSPSTDATIKGHLTQARQGTQSTCPCPVHASAARQLLPNDPVHPTDMPIANPTTPPHELHIMVEPLSRLFTEDSGRFPFRTTSGNQYVMIAYHVDSNTILAAPFNPNMTAITLPPTSPS